MDKVREKNSKNSSKILIILAILVVLLVILGVIREYSKKIALDREIESLTMEMNKLQGEKQQFLSSIELYNSEFFLEEAARNKFNLKREGETVVVIKKEDNNQVGVEKTAQQIKKNEKIAVNFGEWIQYFFGDKNSIKKQENKL